MGYYTRVLSKYEDLPSLAELREAVQTDHPSFRLTIEDGTEDGLGIARSGHALPMPHRAADVKV